MLKTYRVGQKVSCCTVIFKGYIVCNFVKSAGTLLLATLIVLVVKYSMLHFHDVMLT